MNRYGILIALVFSGLMSPAAAEPIRNLSLFGGTATAIQSKVLVTSGFGESNDQVVLSGNVNTLTLLGGALRAFGSDSVVASVGSTTPGIPTSRVMPTAVPLPGPQSFAAGTTDITVARKLTTSLFTGAYGHITLGTNNKLNLVP